MTKRKAPAKTRKPRATKATHPKWEEIQNAIAGIVDERQTKEVVLYQMEKAGYNKAKAEAVMSKALELITDRSKVDEIEYYATHLERVFDLYDKMVLAKEHGKALQALQEHRQTYFMISQLLDG